jgi:hypothetical protein
MSSSASSGGSSECLQEQRAQQLLGRDRQPAAFGVHRREARGELGQHGLQELFRRPQQVIDETHASIATWLKSSCWPDSAPRIARSS